MRYFLNKKKNPYINELTKKLSPEMLCKIENKIITTCSNEKYIMAAYIFGSIANNTYKLTSDIDVAILLDRDSTKKFDLLLFMVNLEKKLDCQVDVVVLNRAHELVKYNVRKHGKLIFERDAIYRKKFDIYSRKTFEDYMYYHKKYVKKVVYRGDNGR